MQVLQRFLSSTSKYLSPQNGSIKVNDWREEGASWNSNWFCYCHLDKHGLFIDNHETIWSVDSLSINHENPWNIPHQQRHLLSRTTKFDFKALRNYLLINYWYCCCCFVCWVIDTRRKQRFQRFQGLFVEDLSLARLVRWFCRGREYEEVCTSRHAWTKKPLISHNKNPLSTSTSTSTSKSTSTSTSKSKSNTIFICNQQNHGCPCCFTWR